MTTLSPEITTLLQNAPYLTVTRYFAIAGLVACVWEHILTSYQEVTLIWMGPFDFIKAIFIFNRYFVEGTLIYVVHVTCGLRPSMTNKGCSDYIMYVTISAIVSMAVANLTITLRIQALWDHRRHITIILIAGFLATYSLVVVFAAFVVKDLHNNTIYEGTVTHACLSITKPKYLPGVWAGMLGFDVFVFGLLLLNALNRPYRQNADVISGLHKDGFVFFMSLLGIRMVNFVLSVIAKPGQIFLIVFFVWAMVSITLSRLLLQIEAVKASRLSLRVWKGDAFELTQYE